jgi:hypothetical protein
MGWMTGEFEFDFSQVQIFFFFPTLSTFFSLAHLASYPIKVVACFPVCKAAGA